MFPLRLYISELQFVLLSFNVIGKMLVYSWDGWPLNNQPHILPFKKKKMCILLGISSCIRLPVAQHPKRTIFTLPNSDVYDSPGSVMVAFDQAVVPGMDNRTVELIKWLGMHVSYVTRGPGPPSRAPKRDSDVLERKKITPKNPGSFQVKVKSYARNGQIVNKRGQKWSAWSVTGIMKKCHLCWGKIQLDTTIYGRIKGISPTKVHDVWVGNIMTPGVKSFRAVHHFHMFSDFLCSCYLCQPILCQVWWQLLAFRWWHL